MSEYKCTKCGMTASSKCVNQRNLFPSDELVTMIRNLTTFDFKVTRDVSPAEDNGLHRRFIQRELTIGFTVNGSENDDGDDLKRFIDLMRRLSPEQFRQVACSHEWECVAEPCMFGCCKPKG